MFEKNLDTQNSCSYNIIKQMFGEGWKKIMKKSNIFSRKLILVFGVAFFAVLLLMTLVKMSFSQDTVASACSVDQKNRVKMVVSVQIERNDTLWDIAKEYYTYEYGSIDEYVREIMKVNSLKGDCIHSGAYIVIPYYTSNDEI